jgi:hypothetical protein
VVNAYKLGPDFYDQMQSGMKYLLHMCFAQGQHEYASFDIIVMNYLYAQNQEMTR